MKRYIKNNEIKSRNQIVLHKTETITDADGNEQVVNTSTFFPKEEQLLAAGWVEYVKPAEEVEKEQKLETVRTSRRELASTDYKVIKCMEAFLTGQDLPYDIAELHREREEQRRIINENE